MNEAFQQRYFTAAQIAPLFGLSAATIKDYAMAGQLPHVALGRKRKVLYFKPEEIEKAFAARSFTVNDILK